MSVPELIALLVDTKQKVVEQLITPQFDHLFECCFQKRILGPLRDRAAQGDHTARAKLDQLEVVRGEMRPQWAAMFDRHLQRELDEWLAEGDNLKMIRRLAHQRTITEVGHMVDKVVNSARASTMQELEQLTQLLAQRVAQREDQLRQLHQKRDTDTVRLTSHRNALLLQLRSTHHQLSKQADDVDDDDEED